MEHVYEFEARMDESYGEFGGDEFPQDSFPDTHVHQSQPPPSYGRPGEYVEEYSERKESGYGYQPLTSSEGQDSYHRRRFVNQGEEGDDNYRESEGGEQGGPESWKRGAAPTRFTSDMKPGETHSVNVGFGQFLTKMNRECWGAAKPLPRANITVPVTKIRFTHTGTPQCYSKEECMAAVLNIQTYYMDLGFPDIPYNFLIGGDGILYHGRGWVKQADRSYHYRNLRRNCIDVAYIGDFQYERLPTNMACVGADFVKYGLKTQRISPFYQVYSFLGEKRAL